jgi:hypothetical protein
MCVFHWSTYSTRMSSYSSGCEEFCLHEYNTVWRYIPEDKTLRLFTHLSWRLLGYGTRVWGSIGWKFLLLRYLLESSGLHALNIVRVVADETGYTATPDLVHLFCNKQGQMKLEFAPTFSPSLMVTDSNSSAVICVTELNIILFIFAVRYTIQRLLDEFGVSSYLTKPLL